MKAGTQYRLWRQGFVVGGAAIAAALMVACGESVTGPAPVASVSVSVTAPTVAVGTKIQATAIVKDDGGNVLDGRTVTWTSSNTEVASVSSTGEVTAVRTGTAEIRATSEGKNGSATVTVIPPPVASVAVTLASPTVAAGTTTTATAVLSDASGNVLTGRTIAWSSSDVAIATVSDQGVVTAVKAGNASIIATSEGKTGSASLTVTPSAIHTITVAIANPALHVGETTQASAVAKDASGNDLTGRPIVWTTNNAEVATVNEQGIVTALKVGTATITATSEGKSGSAKVAVGAAPIHSITVVIADPSMQVGSTRQASAIAKDASGNDLTGRPIVWTTDNAEIATVSPQGIVTGVKPGTATITATSEGKSGSATVTISAPVSGVRAQSLAAGSEHTCAIATDGDTYCWGINNNGQLGTGATSPSSSVPVRVAGGFKFVAVSPSAFSTYGLADNGQLYCWGRCDKTGTQAPLVLTPAPWPTTRTVEVIEAGGDGSATGPDCVLRVGETAWCWGGNLHGQLGRGTRGQVFVIYPEGPVAGNHAFADISSGSGEHVCAITIDGIGYCWGGGHSGERGALGGGPGAAKESLVPQAVVGNHVFKDIAVSDDHTCALTTAGQAYCWGDNSLGQLGAITPTDGCPWPNSLIDSCSPIPVAVSGGHLFTSISVGHQTSCGLKADGEIYCWGRYFGTVPSPFGGGVGYRSVSVGGSHVCAVATDGDAYCRNDNVFGQLGNGTTTGPTSVPTKVVGGIKFRAP